MSELLKSDFIYEIPIEEFQSELAILNEDKKEKILDLLRNHNNINSSKKLEDIKQILRLAIRRYDLELIKILLREEIIVNDMILKIDKITNTASLVNIINSTLIPIHFTIPRSVKYETIDYMITSIISSSIEDSKLICSLHFNENSEVSTIFENSFNNSKIESLYIPKNLTELKDGWCYNTANLTKIKISPSNTNFIYKDDKFLLGKTDLKSDNFNVLLFARRDIKKAVIPSNIEIISPCAFDNCSYLKTIEIQADSKLIKIGRNAFSYSLISSIYFPDNLTELEDEWQIGTNLKTIEISPLNKNFIYNDNKFLLRKSDPKSNKFDFLVYARRDIEEAIIPQSVSIILSNAFDECTQLEKVSIQSNVNSIGHYAFYSCNNLKTVEFAKNSKLRYIGKHAFCSTGLINISIPHNVLIIDDFAFGNCQCLEKVTINKNSILRSVGKYAFTNTCIEHFCIPRNFEKFGEGWNFDVKALTVTEISPLNRNFCLNKNGFFLLGKNDSKSDNFDVLISARLDLREANIPSNVCFISPLTFKNFELLQKVILPEKLKIIGESAFEGTGIKEIVLPSQVLLIGEKAFYDCRNLEVVTIPQNSLLQKIGRKAFENTIITKIFIPSKVSHICDYAFFNCYKLQVVDVADNSGLKVIDECAFACTSIEKISIPNQVLQICRFTFSDCENLQTVKLQKESQLQIIEESAFSNTPIKKIYIPPHVKRISRCAFKNCKNLTNLIIPQNSELISIEKLAFSGSDIDKLYIPEKVICISICGLSLNKFEISPLNTNFIWIDGKYLLGKTDQKSDNFDEFLYANRDSKKIVIPSNISIITPYACAGIKVKTIDIDQNSKLKIIGESAFSGSLIEKFYFPKHIHLIEKDAFYFCKNLQVMDGFENSDLQKIGERAFTNTKISSLVIPSHVSKIGQLAFSNCISLKIVEFSENSELKTIKANPFILAGDLLIMIPVSMKNLVYQ